MRSFACLFAVLLIAAAIAHGQDVKRSEFQAVPEALMQAEFVNLTGQKLRLADYRGKVVLLNLWAIWVGPSREEIPHLIELYSAHKAAGFEVIGLNGGNVKGKRESKRNIQTFALRLKTNYELVRPLDLEAVTSMIFSLSRQQVFPQSILIGRDGTIRGHFVGAGMRSNQKLKVAVDELMAEKD